MSEADEPNHRDPGYLASIPEDRLRQQLEFVAELDRLKTVLRQTPLTDGSRRENSAEHSWHLAVMVMVLKEHAAAEALDVPRVLKMLLLHDVVEIDAGDTYCYDTAGREDQRERESRAAKRLFGLLPEDQAERLRGLWEEFEAGRTPEARFAAAMDRLQPLLHNLLTEGRSWREHGIEVDQVLERNRCMERGVPGLWRRIRSMLERAVHRGHLEG